MKAFFNVDFVEVIFKGVAGGWCKHVFAWVVVVGPGFLDAFLVGVRLVITGCEVVCGVGVGIVVACPCTLCMLAVGVTVVVAGWSALG